MNADKQREKLEKLVLALETLRDDMAAWEPDPVDFDDMYRDMLDEIYGTVCIAGMKYDTSRALELLDPVAFRCGRNDYINSFEDYELNRYRYEEFDTEYGEISDRFHDITEPYVHPENFPEEFEQLEDEFEIAEALMADITEMIE